MQRLLPNRPILRRLLLVFVGLASLPLLVVGGCAALIKTTEYRAQSFCDSIPAGSEIRLAVARFEGSTGKPDVRHYADSAAMSHVFVFPFSFEDRAYCQVRLDSSGHVVSKQTFTLYD